MVRKYSIHNTLPSCSYISHISILQNIATHMPGHGSTEMDSTCDDRMHTFTHNYQVYIGDYIK